MSLENKKQLKNQPATLGEVEKIVEDSVDELARSCAVQFTAIDARFDRIESTMATKDDLNNLYRIMVNRFENVDKRFEKLEEKTDTIIEKIDSLIIFMKGHEKRIHRIEKHLAFA